MNGYIRNKSGVWRHAMKRSIGPNHKISLDELYEDYGKKHDLKTGEQFAEWLRQVKLRDSSVWEVVYKPELKNVKKTTKEKLVKEKLVEEEKSEKKSTEESTSMMTPYVKKPLEISDITNMSVRTARDELKKITDINLLKYSYQEARQLADKDTLCRMLNKRIKELEITRR